VLGFLAFVFIMNLQNNFPSAVLAEFCKFHFFSIFSIISSYAGHGSLKIMRNACERNNSSLNKSIAALKYKGITVTREPGELYTTFPRHRTGVQ
jgi:hypothetical protein